MSSALLSIQKTVFARLRADQDLMMKITGVFDEVPRDQLMPYVTVGDATSSPFRTMSRFGEEVTITLHIWSQYNGFKESLEILEDLNRLLADQELEVTGYDTVACFYEFSETIRDPDGITRHVPVRYRIKLQKQ